MNNHLNFNTNTNNITNNQSDINSIPTSENFIDKNFSNNNNINIDLRNCNLILFRNSIRNFLQLQNSTEEISFNFLLHLQPDLNKIKENESFIIEDIINNNINPSIFTNLFFTDLYFFVDEFKGKKFFLLFFYFNFFFRNLFIYLFPNFSILY